MWPSRVLLFYAFFGVFEAWSISLRSGPLSTTSRVEVYQVSPEGEAKKVDFSGESKVQAVLCSDNVVSRLERCPVGEESVENLAVVSERTADLYPMSDDYREAVQTGHACPLPAPFMTVSKISGTCCVGRDEHVWPNFCPNIEKIGSVKSDQPLWDAGGSVHLLEPRVQDDHSVHTEKGKLHKMLSNHGEQHQVILPGVFQVGRPDIPHNYSRYKAGFGQLLTYFISGVVAVCLGVYIQGKLEEESAIQRGKNREQLLSEMRKNDEEEISDDGDSSIASLSPAHGMMDRGEQHFSEAGRVSMAFGLLPSLPRGRSTNSSALNSAR